MGSATTKDSESDMMNVECITQSRRQKVALAGKAASIKRHRRSVAAERTNNIPARRSSYRPPIIYRDTHSTHEAALQVTHVEVTRWGDKRSDPNPGRIHIDRNVPQGPLFQLALDETRQETCWTLEDPIYMIRPVQEYFFGTGSFLYGADQSGVNVQSSKGYSKELDLAI
ncbi:hypothetical protein V493_01971 [Pseudogymnoascus sp. VKM F-4281 (FW-2241)]|nr:hypothetical protein V493_01971 [Pseudogymnoascus sp. VKM F-4281 (FW-2241)]